MKLFLTPLVLLALSCSGIKNHHITYSDHFEGEFQKEFWETRQNTHWEVKEGYLVGTPSPAEYQATMRAKNDTHTGQWPIIRLLKIPAEFTCTMRIKYEGKEFERNRPLLDVGHHINSFLFRETSSRLLLKDKTPLIRQGQFLPINQWADIKITLQKGKLNVMINGVEEVYENPAIGMHDHSEFTFKGLTNGRILFDHITITSLEKE